MTTSAPGIATIRARHLLTEFRRRAADEMLPALGDYGIVSAVSGDLVSVRLIGDDDAATQMLARAAGPPITVGDTVALVPMKGGGYVAVEIGGTISSFPTAVDFLDGITVGGVPLIGGHIAVGQHIYLTSVVPVGALTGVTLSANRVYYVPIFVSKDFPLDSIVFEITTIVAGDVQAGLYTCLSTFVPGSRLLVSSKSTQTTIGVKTFSIGSSSIDGGRWYFLGFCSTSAMALRGSTTGANLISPRGGATPTQARLMAFEDIAAGWATIPATASAGSLSDTYLHVGARSA